MWKRLLAILLILTLSCSLFACTEESTEESVTTTGDPTPTGPSEDPDGDDTTTGGGDSQDPPPAGEDETTSGKTDDDTKPGGEIETDENGDSWTGWI